MTPVLHAPGDVVRDVEAHLDELARRSAVVMMAFLFGAVGAWWWFDAWFVTLLQQVAGPRQPTSHSMGHMMWHD